MSIRVAFVIRLKNNLRLLIKLWCVWIIAFIFIFSLHLFTPSHHSQAKTFTRFQTVAKKYQATPIGGSGFFTSNGQALGNSNSTGVALGDLDGDGDLDAFVANNVDQGNRVWRNDGTGQFSSLGTPMGNWDSEFVALGDLDGDGDLDAYVANFNQGNRIWLNRGDGRFDDSGQSLGNGHSVGVALGDLDGDGDLDAFVTNFSQQPNRVWLNDGSGSFSDSGQLLGVWKSEVVALGDLDGDGDLDAFVGNREKSNRVWLNNGSGLFSDNGQSTGTNNTLGVDMGDLDGDGDLDAFIGNESNQPNQIFFNNGGQQGGQAADYSNSGQSLGHNRTYAVALGDLDGDGDLDGFAANYDGQPNRVWRNNGTGFFGSTGEEIGNAFSYGVALGDLDGDGDLDGFVANHNSQPNRVWLNQNRTDLALFQQVSPATALPGQAVTYTLTYTNNGPVTAQNIELTFLIPTTLLNAVANSTPPLTQLSEPDFRWQRSNLNSGEAGQIIISGILTNRLPIGPLAQSASITNTVVDLHLNNNIGQATLNIANMAPIPQNDTATLAEDSHSNWLTVLANDDDANEDPLTIIAVGSPLIPQAIVTTTGTHLHYTPAPDFVGSDQVSYTVADGNGGTATAQVFITVTNTNDNPSPMDDVATVLEDSFNNPLMVLTNDSVFPDTNETLSLVTVAPALFGTTQLGGSQTIFYTPSPHFFGTDSFTYTVQDNNGGQASATAIINVQNVNDPPQAQNDTALILVNTSHNPIDVLANDSDAPDQAENLRIVHVTQPTQAGQITISPLAHSLIFTAAQSFTGSEAISYTITDGNGGQASAILTLFIDNFNVPPSAIDDQFTMNEDQGPTRLTVLENDRDLNENDALNLVALGQTSHNGSLAMVDATTLHYTPAPHFFGTDTFTYTIGDAGGLTDTGQVTVVVTPQNDLPTAIDDDYTLAEDHDWVWLSVLDNDQIAPDQNETLSLIALSSHPAQGTAHISGTHLIRFKPASNFNGTTTLTYTINDGTPGSDDTATVTIQVLPVPDPPQATVDYYSVLRDTPRVLSVLANDLDPDNDALQIVQVSQPSHGTNTTNGSTIVYIPSIDFVGSDAFSYTISDGTFTAITTVTVAVRLTNTIPSFSSTPNATAVVNAPYQGEIIAHDPEDQANLTLTAIQIPRWLSLTDHHSGRATLSGMPTLADLGLADVVLQASDDLSISTQSFTIRVQEAGTYYLPLIRK